MGEDGRRGGKGGEEGEGEREGEGRRRKSAKFRQAAGGSGLRPVSLAAEPWALPRLLGSISQTRSRTMQTKPQCYFKACLSYKRFWLHRSHLVRGWQPRFTVCELDTATFMKKNSADNPRKSADNPRRSIFGCCVSNPNIGFKHAFSFPEVRVSRAFALIMLLRVFGDPGTLD